VINGEQGSWGFRPRFKVAAFSVTISTQAVVSCLMSQPDARRGSISCRSRSDGSRKTNCFGWFSPCSGGTVPVKWSAANDAHLTTQLHHI
jgi:hypothetical protein